MRRNAEQGKHASYTSPVPIEPLMLAWRWLQCRNRIAESLYDLRKGKATCGMSTNGNTQTVDDDLLHRVKHWQS